MRQHFILSNKVIIKHSARDFKQVYYYKKLNNTHFLPDYEKHKDYFYYLERTILDLSYKLS